MGQLPEVGILGGGGGLLGLPFEELVGARVLLLDETNDISRSVTSQSLYANVFRVYIAHDPGRLTRCYWDVVTVMDPLLPQEGTLGFLGFGGGTAAVVSNKKFAATTLRCKNARGCLKLCNNTQPTLCATPYIAHSILAELLPTRLRTKP
eukprot:1173152-Prorocentrum_minimum.AAC.4